jgi:hypothetical protein
MVKRAQYKIMQMAFLILAIFLFFVLVFVLFTKYRLGGLASNVRQLEKDSAISSLWVLVNSPELSCDFSDGSSWCIDKDKVMILSTSLGESYEDYWPVASIELLEVYPNSVKEQILCPNYYCNSYEIFDNGQEQIQKYSVYVNLCEQTNNYRESCSLAKLIVGVNI